MIDVVCVKWGDLYDDRYVRILRDSVARNTTIEHRFICFSDTIIPGVNCIQLPPGEKGWWNKMTLFNTSHGLDERIVYFDLDTAITGNIDWLLNYRGNIMGIENLGVNNSKYEDITQYQGKFQSGVMAWHYYSGNEIWNIYKSNRKRALESFRGDGEFLNAILKNPDLIQLLYPGELRSYKYECYARGLKKGTSILCFHGEPRPHQAFTETVKPWGIEYKPRKWVEKYWREN